MPRSARRKPESIDDYLASIPPDRRAVLQRVRRAIHAIVPGVEECISYAIPAFRHEGRVIAGFLATAKGCSYFPFSGSTLTTLASDVAKYDCTKSALHFERALPVALLRKLLRARIAEGACSRRDLAS
jgi:uncharacterized protein YdhG (YjbR/CyaY superfamily)